jgi:hypothetical protein
MQKVKDKLAQHGMKVVNFGVTGAGDEAGIATFLSSARRWISAHSPVSLQRSFTHS